MFIAKSADSLREKEGGSMKNVIVVPTHRTGLKFLENLLSSFKGYDKYPILVVICDYKRQDREVLENIKDRFKELPITLESIETNSFELGGLYAAYMKTDYDEFFLLSHSCELVRVDLLDILFKVNPTKGVAFALQTGSWVGALGKRNKNEKFI